MSKNRKQRQNEYDRKYGGIPLDYEERLNYLYDKFNLDNNPAKVEHILQLRNNILFNLQYYDLDIVSLYEIPLGHKRPRFRVITRKNFNMEAICNKDFVHVYQPDAAESHQFMTKKLNDEELFNLNGLIYTPVNIEYRSYFPTPSYYNAERTILAEIGLDRPSIMKPDADNVEKHYMDMYNWNVWIDDGTVNNATVKKFYSVLPRVEISLRYLNCVYNKYQAKRISERKDFDKCAKPLIYLDSEGQLTNYPIDK